MPISIFVHSGQVQREKTDFVFEAAQQSPALIVFLRRSGAALTAGMPFSPLS